MARIDIDIDVDGKDVGRQIREAIEDGIEDSTDDVADGIRYAAKAKIQSENAIFTGELYGSFRTREVQVGDRTVVQVRNTADHAPYQEEGVSGTRVKRDTPYSYTDKAPPLEALLPWVRKNLVGGPFGGPGDGDGGSGGGSSPTKTTTFDPRDPRDFQNEPETVTVNDWGNWEKSDPRLFNGQEIKFDDAGTIRTGEVTSYDDAFIRVDLSGNGNADVGFEINDPAVELLEYENWWGKNPIFRKEIIRDEVYDKRGTDKTGAGKTPKELMDVVSDWFADDFLDRMNYPEVAKRVVSNLSNIHKKDGASANTKFNTGRTIINAREGRNNSGLYAHQRDYWIDDPTLWHEGTHTFPIIAGSRMKNEGTKFTAKRQNKKNKFDPFRNGIPPLSYDENGDPTHQYINEYSGGDKDDIWPVEYHLFIEDEDDFWNHTPSKSDIIGWEDWKDDVSAVLQNSDFDWGDINYDSVEGADYSRLFAGKGFLGQAEEYDTLRWEVDGEEREGYITHINAKDAFDINEVIVRDEDDNQVIFNFDQNDGRLEDANPATITGHHESSEGINERPDVSEWMPENDDPVRNLLEASNRAWWKMAKTISESDDPTGSNSKAVVFGLAYAATNSQETMANSRQLLELPGVKKEHLRILYLYHPYLVKAHLDLAPAPPSTQKKLEELAKDNDWDDLMKFL